MSDLPKDPNQQLDWLVDYINRNQAEFKPETVAGLVLKLVDGRIRLTRIQNGQDDEVNFAALQEELGG